jgi:hypothetical protein
VSKPSLYVCLFDNTPDYDSPSVWVFTSYAAALAKCCEEIQERCSEDVDEDSVAIRELIAKGDLQAAHDLYAESCDGGRFVIIEERIADPEAIEREPDGPTLYDGPMPRIEYKETGEIDAVRTLLANPALVKGATSLFHALTEKIQEVAEKSPVKLFDPELRAAVAAENADPVVTVTPVPKPYAAPSLKRIEPSEAIRAAFGQEPSAINLTPELARACTEAASRDTQWCSCREPTRLDPRSTICSTCCTLIRVVEIRGQTLPSARTTVDLSPQPSDAEVRRELLTAARAILAEHAAARKLGRADALSHCHEAAMQLTIAIKDYLETEKTP